MKYGSLKSTNVLRDDFKTHPPVDPSVPADFYCSKQWQPPGTAGQPAVRFEAAPKPALSVISLYNLKQF